VIGLRAPGVGFKRRALRETYRNSQFNPPIFLDTLFDVSVAFGVDRAQTPASSHAFRAHSRSARRTRSEAIRVATAALALTRDHQKAHVIA
jgi:hypothetical protein